MSTYREYVNGFYKEYNNRIYNTVNELKQNNDFSVLLNFKNLLYKKITDNKLTSQDLKIAFRQVIDEFNKFEKAEISKQSLADAYVWFGKELHSLDMRNQYRHFFNRKAYDLYVEIQDFHGIINSGSCLIVDYIGPWTLSDEECEDAISIIKICLNAIEKKEGKVDSYCYFINDCTIFNLLSQRGCQKYLKDFLIDYNISDTECGLAFYHQLCSAIGAVVRTNDDFSEEEYHFWQDKYSKYLNIYNLYKDKRASR